MRESLRQSRPWPNGFRKVRSAKHGRVPEIQQLNSTECGAACLTMLLNYYGHKCSLSEVRDRLSVGRDGLSALSIVQAARSYGFRVRAVSLAHNDFSQVKLPAIIHWEFNHFVVVERWSKRFVEIVDPASGRKRLSSADFDTSFTGVVIMLEPGVQFSVRSYRPQLSLSAYLKRSLQAPGVLLQILLASLLLQGLTLLIPLFTKLVVDNIIPYGRDNFLGMLSLGIGLWALLQVVMLGLRSLLLVYLQARLDSQLNLGFFEHLLSLPYSFFQQRSTGDLLARLSSNTIIRDTLSSQLISSLLDGGLVVVYLGVLLWQAPALAAVTLGLGLVQIIMLLFTSDRLRQLSKRSLVANGKAQGYLAESLSGIATLKAAGGEGRAMEQWSNLFFEQLNLSVRQSYLSALLDTLQTVLRTLSPLVLLGIGTLQVLSGQMGLGTMLALNTMAASFLTPLSSLVSSGQRLQLVQAHFERISDVLTAQPEQNLAQVQSPPQLSGKVELQEVSFSYAPDIPASLTNINLKLRPGQKVALVGRTGSGKSTLGKLLVGLIQPGTGEILYDDLPLAQLNLSEVRGQLGVVLQEAAVFSGSIRQNIAFNRPDASLEEVMRAAELAALHPDISQMPMGYETLVAEGGSALSGGQRQRLALARALMHSPSILLLDEATSHLDVTTEQQVEENLNTLNCTRIVIAHRLSTVRNADLIVVIDGGQIVEQGTHAELLALGGYYAHLVQSQLNGGECPASRVSESSGGEA